MSEHTALPLSRVKRLIRMDPDVKNVSSDTAVLVAKATELFLSDFIKKAATFTREEKRVTIQYKDIARAAKYSDPHTFLEDLIPMKNQLTASRVKKIKERREDIESAFVDNLPPAIGADMVAPLKTPAAKEVKKGPMDKFMSGGSSSKGKDVVMAEGSPSGKGDSSSSTTTTTTATGTEASSSVAEPEPTTKKQRT